MQEGKTYFISADSFRVKRGGNTLKLLERGVRPTDTQYMSRYVVLMFDREDCFAKLDLLAQLKLDLLHYGINRAGARYFLYRAI